ncbi:MULTISPECIES: hypothetical protein [unclassified Nitratiruptor]|uniref:hypothetical protein n=1 Tax=unclassified Nitratiruptor TaxID=2624044 RepID=UPI001916640D|nr:MULTISPECIES: hypothetical protein [unclassified Nitratiruptor]BCD60256.1 hypothetical protein NitYY0810_C1021 [Nitratiruptor sp. YY08-10]BCD64255.1 hypothetical protein NitYY0814_C1100 [Nitratiruptor sp. YY08-14]
MKSEEKKELLDSFEEAEYEQSLLDVKDLILTFLVIAIIFALIFPKIYISNQIYYKSRKINKLLDDYEILKEEHRLLQQKLEQIRFKNQVLDSIF